MWATKRVADSEHKLRYREDLAILPKKRRAREITRWYRWRVKEYVRSARCLIHDDFCLVAVASLKSKWAP
ncbi:hypothetical protein P3T16_006907 [Paraburkholderia sp. GAS42]